MTKCTFHKFGPSGTVEKFDGLCVLPLNIINEKIYVFLWFWFIILTVITGMQVIYRFVLVSCLIIKGQIISKCLFRVFNFFQKRNENTSHISKNELICSFFRRIHDLTICFRN